MTLDELLSELREGILNDRTDRTAGTSDYLWTDATLVRYINEAQRRFAVQGFVIRDATTTEVTKITLVEGQTLYPLHESILGVISAKVSTYNRDLVRVGHPVLAAYRLPSDTWDPSDAYDVLPPGPPVAFTTDEGLSTDDSDSFSVPTLRIYPEPDATAAGTEIRLRVVRKPLDKLDVNNLGAVPEIPEDHHIEMLDWAAYLALRIVDDDAGSPARATQFAQSFEVHVANARRTAMRKLFAPMPWGFGRGGFTWES